MSDWNVKKCDWVEAYVLGGLTAEETREFEEHLRSCADCDAEARELGAIIDLLPEANPLVPVPAGMKQRIMGKVLQTANPKAEEAKTSPMPVAAQALAAHAESAPPAQAKPAAPAPAAQAVPAALSAHTVKAAPAAAGRTGRIYRMITTIGLSAAVLVLALYSAQLRRDVHDLKSYIALAAEPATALKVNEAVTLSPATNDIVAKGLATILIDSTGTHLVVQAEKLPELKGNQAFQVWLLKGKNPVNAGTFLTRDGTGALYYTFEPEDYDTIAITLEPDALGKEPRGSIILAAPISVNS